MAMEELQTPSGNPWSKLSARACEYLDLHIGTQEDLHKVPQLASSLEQECHQIENSLSELELNISVTAEKCSAHFQDLHSLLKSLSLHINSAKGMRNSGASSKPENQPLIEELPALAREVAQVEKVRVYAETAMKLEALIGDLEDAISSAVVGSSKLLTSRKLLGPSETEVLAESQKKLFLAIATVKEIEDIIDRVVKSKSHWDRLVIAVDLRIDRAMATVRPLAISQYRTLLSSFGWPPPLITSNLDDSGDNAKVSTLLFDLHGRIKEQFSDSFLALCILQSVHLRRKTRQFDQLKLDKGSAALKLRSSKLSLHETLWGIEELASQIESRAEYHFPKWTARPELIFALVYKVSQEYVDQIDDILQPLIDKSRLLGYSAREEWVSAMVSMLSTYLAKRVFPEFVKSLLEEESVQSRSSLLQLIDLVISFDKKMQVLAIRSGIASSVSEDLDSFNILEPHMYCMSIFCDRPDWLDLWAEIELKIALEKLRRKFESTNLWKIDMKAELLSEYGSKMNTKCVHSKFLFSTREDYKSPKVAEAVMVTAWSLINRCRTLPDALLRFKFVRTTVAPILSEYLEILLQWCQEAEALTALADEEAMVKVAVAINAARYCEFTMSEWCEDIYFLDLQIAHELSEREADDMDTTSQDFKYQAQYSPEVSGSIFDKEVEELKQFQANWLAKLVSVILRGFDARCHEYVRNKKQWQESGNSVLEEDNKKEDSSTNFAGSEASVSSSFVDALDTLQGQLKSLKEALNAVDFMNLWRSVAAGLDHFIYSNIVLSKAKFSEHGVSQFKVDINALFRVFKNFCARPVSFFPKLGDSLRLLSLPPADVKHIQAMFTSSAEDNEDATKLNWLRKKGVQKMHPSEAKRVLKQRLFEH